jgi:hypothetical protein
MTIDSLKKATVAGECTCDRQREVFSECYNDCFFQITSTTSKQLEQQIKVVVVVLIVV